MIKQYKVRGSGSFPIDMLRYDCSFPVSEFDSGQIEKSGERTVCLASSVTHAGIFHSKLRWASFGWQVVTNGLEPDGS